MRLRLSTSLAVGLLALSTAGCHHRMRGDARHAYYDVGQDPQQAAPVEAAPGEPQEAAPVEATATPTAPPEDAVADQEAPAPEVTTTPPEEVVASTEPPEPVYEEQTPQPAAANVVWVPGYWQPEGSSWSWYVGTWRPAPVGYIYAEPHYERVNSRVVFVRGYWRQPSIPMRSYGGTKIVFVRPVRPADYHVSYQRQIHHVDGLPPGARLEPHYQPQPIVHAHYVAPPPRTQAIAAVPVAPRRDVRGVASAPPRVAAPPVPAAPAPAPARVAAPTPPPAPAPARVAMNTPSPAPMRAAPPPAPVHAAPPPAPVRAAAPPPAPVHAAPPPPPAARPAAPAPAPASTTKKKRP